MSIKPELRFAVKAGSLSRSDCPVLAKAPVALPEGPLTLRTTTGSIVPAQRISERTLAFVEPGLPSGEERVYSLSIEPTASTASAVSIERTDENRLSIRIGDAPLTKYVFADVPARPYFFPLFAPGNVAITRSYPMEKVEGETSDHHHHKSVWIAHGDVNGVDNWSEETGHGHTVHKSFDAIYSGPVCGGFASKSVWTTAGGAEVLSQDLAFATWAVSDDVRLLDFDVALTASFGDALFGDTKEGGILSVRVASAIDVKRGGKIENGVGGVDEENTWGKPAPWCDYSGTIGTDHVGVAILNHPESFRYPSHWHVRNYGLMTANPFGYGAFTDGRENGAYTLPAGETLRFRYRIVLHRGDAAGGKVAAHYANYETPPTVEIV